MSLGTNRSLRTALKEWKVLWGPDPSRARGGLVGEGGGRGQRGGVGGRADRFLLYPTYFHEKAAEIAPRLLTRLDAAHAERPAEGVVRVELLARGAAGGRVESLEPRRRIERAHGLDWSAVQSRFEYRGVPMVQVVAVRVARLVAPVEIVERRRYEGCVSWVELDEGLDVDGATPVLDDASFGERMAELRVALGEPTRE